MITLILQVMHKYQPYGLCTYYLKALFIAQITMKHNESKGVSHLNAFYLVYVESCYEISNLPLYIED